MGKTIIKALLFIFFIMPLVVAIEFQTVMNAQTGRPDIVRTTNQSGNNLTADFVFTDGRFITNVFAVFFNETDPLWTSNQTDYLNSTDYIINITAVNTSMKNYVDTKSQYDNDTNTWTGNQTNYYNVSDVYNKTEITDDYIPYTNSIKEWNLSSQNITDTTGETKVWFSGGTLMVGR